MWGRTVQIALALVWGTLTCAGCRCQTDGPTRPLQPGSGEAAAGAAGAAAPAAAAEPPASASPTAPGKQAEPAKQPQPDVTCPAGTKKDVGESSVRCLRNGQPDGPEIVWNPETGKPQAELVWKQGKKVGAARYFYPNGKLRIEANYLDDKEEGLHRQYANERVINEGEMHRGKPEGKWRWYRPNDGGLDRVECQHEGAVVWVERSESAANDKACP
jgi:hypothetical protein